MFRIDRKTGAMKPAGVYESGTSPSSLVLNVDGSRMYSANETDRVGEERHGTVSSFSVARGSGALTLLNTIPSGGAGPTYVSLHPSGRYLFVANYFGGSVSVLPIREDGSLAEPMDTKSPTGKIGPTTAPNAPNGSFAFSGHDRTHAHMIQSDPSGKFVLHVDLGLDRIFIWSFDVEKGSLTESPQASFALPPGDGPRHFHFHPNGRWFYSIQEEGSTIVAFDYVSGTGTLTPKQTISTLPEGFEGSNFCSEILVSNDGRFVYAGNRLHDSIGIFSIEPNGELKHVADEWTRGNYPRSFNFDPSGEFLFCCNQRADHVSIFKVERESGMLQFTGQYAAVGNPSCIVFNELA
jgi:6-phosphogluconolactonase (cycloisomerase 2 family)